MSELNPYKQQASKSIQELIQEITLLKLRIADLESQLRWIPVSERPPETYKPVLTVDMSEATQIPVPAFYNPDTKCWSTHFKYDLWVTHWMPLPSVPESEGE